MASARAVGSGSICLVTNDLDHVVRNSGIGTYYSLVAPLLVNASWRVHILYLGGADDPRRLAQAPVKLRRQGVSFSLLGDFETPELLKARTIHSSHGEFDAGMGVRILRALEELHRVYQFDLIEFPDWLAFGFRTIQARRTGRCLDSVRLCVKLHGTSSWQRDGNHRWPEGPTDLALDYRERYAFENADVQMSPSRYMLDYVQRQGWQVKDAVVAYPFPDPILPPRRTDLEAPSEVVFFGRLEIRKGLDLFLDAAQDLPSGVGVTFLGRDTCLPGGESATAYIRRRMGGRSCSIRTDLFRDEALKYLAGAGRLAVIASLSETFGFMVAECAVNGLPFIAAKAGGTSEVVPDPVVQEGLFFEPSSRDLRRALKAYFKMTPAHRRALRLQTLKVVDPVAHNQRMTKVYDEILERYREEHAPPLMFALGGAMASATRVSAALRARSDAGLIEVERASDQAADMRATAEDDDCAPLTLALPGPLVTVAIPHFNLGLYLPATLEAIATQTYPHLEVVVIDDGSTCPISVRVFEEQRRLYPQFRFLSQRNSGPGAARNRVLAEARGEFFVPVDADNVPKPMMIERFVAGMVRNPALSVLTCFLQAFRHEEGIEADMSEFVYMPSGGPFVLSCFENVYGDTNAIFRTQHLRDAGGFESDPNTFIEDWETFVKLAAVGLKIDVIPDALFYYRLRGDNRSLVMSGNYTNFYPFVQRMIQRRFHPISGLSPLDTETLWLGMAGFGNRQSAPSSDNAHLLAEIERLRARSSALRYRIADRLNSCLKWLPAIHKTCKLFLLLLAWVRRATGRARTVAPVANEALNAVDPEVVDGGRAPVGRPNALDASSRKVA